MPKIERDASPLDPDLDRLVRAWPTLSLPLRRAMLALVEAGSTQTGEQGEPAPTRWLAEFQFQTFKG
jgi:hypothetical protein